MSWQVDSLEEPYDYDSIMHSSQWTYRNGEWIERVRPKDPNAKIGQREKLSEGDIKQTNKLYRCPLICGSQVRGTFGTITSPNYPQAYSANTRCLWEITVPVGSTITLSFTSFNLEGYVQCDADYVKIFNGPSKNEALLITLCGRDLPKTVSSTSNTMTMEFVSDSSVQEGGFSATFQAAPAVQDRNCQNTEHWCQQECKDTELSIECACRRDFELQPDGKSCKVLCRMLLTGVTGEPLSPVESSSSQCVWKLVQTQRNQVFRLTFTEFDLIKENCQDNSVRVVRRLENNKTIDKRYCGKTLPPTIISYDELTLVFDMGSSGQPTHFRANYRYEDNECATNNGDCEYRCYKTPGTYHCKCKKGFELYEKSKCRQRGFAKCLPESCIFTCLSELKLFHCFLIVTQYARKLSNTLW
ncbi:unnamed protein product [Dibothriocephalus latus]|uniref:Metalloendopeptidase n=1 Tax=Dibothriocephalus latus TaxID=60516 RepID=A0A3P6UXU1_DIBLA|nr:unnamed protein product [Dibothriocephalus latus]